MALFQLKWLRRLVRKNTNPIAHGPALAWRDRLSIAYAILAWNAFGFVCYAMFTGRNDWAKFHGIKSPEELASSSSAQWAKTLNIDRAKVIQISGFRKVNEFEINNQPDQAEQGSLIGEAQP